MSSGVSACPVCAKQIPILELLTHANHCLDEAASRDALHIPSPPSSPMHSENHHLKLDKDSRHYDGDDTDFCTPVKPNEKEPSLTLSRMTNSKSDGSEAFQKGDVVEASTGTAVPRDMPISKWLGSLGLSKYAQGIIRAGFRSLAELKSAPPDDKAWREKCGVATMGARRRLASEVAKASLAMHVTQPRGADHQLDESINPPSTSAMPRKLATKRKRWAIFDRGYTATSPQKKTPRTQEFGATQPSPAGGGRFHRTWKHRFSQRVPGTSFTVDSFKAAISDPGCTTFFLTHFHSDHYGGLRKSSLPPGSRVLCSAVTAALVKSLLRVPEEFIRVLPLGRKIDIPEQGIPGGGASVWFYDANHCPGAVILLYFIWRTKRYVLHCGDCRFDRAVFDKHEKLVEVVRKGELDYMHLDTTYCNPKYVFPPQSTILAQVVAAARHEDKRTRSRCLYFFGTYSIGKEKVFMAVAEALNLKIYADKRKRDILSKLDFGKRLADRLVDKAGNARVQVVPMFALSADGLRSYASRNGLNSEFIGRGLAIVFRPTGWSFRGNAESPKGIVRSSDQAISYELAYSEHSSYSELVDFVQWAKPAKLIPTVGARSAQEADEIRTRLGHTDKPLRSIP